MRRPGNDAPELRDKATGSAELSGFAAKISKKTA
jgi:hypothetical protein